MAKQRVQYSSHELDPDKNTQWAKLEIQQTFQIRLEDLQKHRSSIQKQIASLPRDATEAIKPENFAHFPELILCLFLARICESSTHDFCVLHLYLFRYAR